MNREDFISKKELLRSTGISYGQLYRWRRKGLIPEEWFMRRSTFTGQETFFPRDKVLARVERIKGLKDEDLSLDDIAGTVAPKLSEVALPLQELAEGELLSPAALELYRELRPQAAVLHLGDLLATYVLDSLLKSGHIGRDEARGVLSALEEGHSRCQGRECDLVMTRKMGVAMCFLVSSKAEVHLETEAHEVARLHLPECLEELAVRLRRRKENHD